MRKVKPDVAHGASRCPGLPRKASLFICLSCQPAQGRCQEGWTGRQVGGLWLRAFPGGRGRKQQPSGRWALPHCPGPSWETRGLTYWKGRRMARMSPLKKRVMSSTKITPWQEVKSNYRVRTGVSCGACPGWLHISGGPRWAVCWPEGRGLHTRQKPAFLFQEASPDPTRPFHLSLARDPNLELPFTPIPEALPCPGA